MPSNSRDDKQEDQKLHLEVARQMVILSTSGFGLVAALAWNSLIQELVNSYLKKWLPGNGQLISLFLYAIIVTVLAVVVTLQLSKLVKRLEEKD